MSFITQATGMETTRARPITWGTRGGGVVLRARKDEFLDLDLIAQRAPSVFAETKHDSRSERYQYLDTRELMAAMIKEGFGIIEVRQGGSRIEGKKDFTKHMIRFSTPGGKFNIEPRVGAPSSATVTLINAHDGTSSYQLMSGFMVWLCTNGMMTSEDYSTLRVGHTKNAREKIIDAAYKVIEDFPRAVDEVKRWAGTELTQVERLAFADAARELRWTPTEDKAPPVEPARLLAPRRMADNGRDMWSTLNVVQEHLIQGGDRYFGERRTVDQRTGRPVVQRVERTVGKVNSVDQDKAINRAIWKLTQTMMELKAA